MDKKEQAKLFLYKVKFKAYIYLLICISLNIITFILLTNSTLARIMLFWHPASLLLTGFYVVLMILKFKFIKVVDRIIEFDRTEDRVTELYVHLAEDLNKTVDEASLAKKLYLGELTYNRASANSAIKRRMDYKIIHGIYNIYNQK